MDIIYRNCFAKIQNNGNFSEPIHIQKGVHQGGPASSLLFLICAETLAIELRSNEHIQGISMNGILNLLNQFADDMDIFSLFNSASLNAILETLTRFHTHSGFKVNYNKTQIYRIGSIKNTNAQLYTQQQVDWTNNPINVLGIYITGDSTESLKLNYDVVLKKS